MPSFSGLGGWTLASSCCHYGECVLYLTRHGRTSANAAGVLQGRTDNPLDEVGLQQASAIGFALADVDVVICSPLLRARATAAAIGRPVEVDERWIELDFGANEGLRRDQIADDEWHRLRTDPFAGPVNGESLAALMERVAPAVAEALERSRHQRLAVVSHVLPIKAAVAAVLGVGIEVSWRCHLDPASITRISCTSAGPLLHGFNDTGHLAGLESSSQTRS